MSNKTEAYVEKPMRRESIDLSPGPGVSGEAFTYPWFATDDEVKEATDRALRGVLGNLAPQEERSGKSL